ncbi:hypothetical protein AHF37_03373 [Paragonimus kellicotti]|nr:hypothetical protein AHF37_03373 [Paragonimus kellicotti]
MILDRDPTTEIIRAFKLFDDDDSGRITYRNLKKIARELGENLTDQELRAMIEEFDRDGDGSSELPVQIFVGTVLRLIPQLSMVMCVGLISKLFC